MASNASILFLVLCGVFLLIFLSSLIFLLYLCFRRVCIAKIRFEIVDVEGRPENNQVNNHHSGHTNETSTDARVMKNDCYSTHSSAMLESKTALNEEHVQFTIL